MDVQLNQLSNNNLVVWEVNQITEAISLDVERNDKMERNQRID